MYQNMGEPKMNKRFRMIGLVLVLLLGMLSLSALASADSDFYEIVEVEVDGITVFDEYGSSTTSVEVELDDSLEVEVKIEGIADDTVCDLDDCEVDVKVKVWLGGYEYDDIEETSSTFDIEPGVTYTKTITLELPDDLDVEDDNTYTLYVEVYDDDDSDRVTADLYTERPRHSLDLVDVVYDSRVDAGELMDVEVRLENLGESKEDDIKVQISLGDDTSVEYLDELASFEEDNEDEESSDSVDLLLNLADDMETGYYDLTVTVTYDRGHETLEEVYSVYVSGEDVSITEETETTESVSEADVTVSLSSTSTDAEAGEESSYTLTFVNNGGSSETYSVSVNGVAQWASSDVSPSVVMVSAGATEEVVVGITPDADAKGDYSYTLTILDGDDSLIEEIEMSMEVDSSSLFGTTGSALKVAFVILIVLIIIVGLIVAFRKLGDDDDDDPLEPREGQTYY